jgi:hypothetical protein
MEQINNRQANLLIMASEIIGRMQLATKLGTDTYDGYRDIYTALGYPKKITSGDYWTRYKRHDIAKAIIDRPVKASWKGEIEVIENLEKEQTVFEKAWVELFDRLKLKSILLRADKLTGLGRYSVLFLGLSDVRNIEDLRKPVRKGNNVKLLYVKPLAQSMADIAEYVTDPTNERFGLPLFYSITIKSGSTDQSAHVHYTRMVHLVEDVVEDEVNGTPRLEAVYNRLVDLEKLIGGDAEMFWRGARPGYTGEVNPDYQMGEDAYKDLKEQIDEFENNLRRILINEGVNLKALEQQIADPINHVDVQMQMISAVTGIPKRILTGSERGELSSAQDKLEWIAYVTSRREEQNEPMILRPFIDRCIEIGVLPTPSQPYKVVWDQLFTLSDKEKAEIGEIRARAMRDYTSTAAMEIMPPDLFFEYILNMTPTQILEIIEKMGDLSKIERPVSSEEEEVIKKDSNLKN